MDAVQLRAVVIMALMATGVLLAQDGAAPDPVQDPAEARLDFAIWLQGVVSEARTRGFSDQLVADTLSGLAPLDRVIASDRNQAELNPGFARYLSGRLTPTMIRNGRLMASQHAALLGRIEKA